MGCVHCKVPIVINKTNEVDNQKNNISVNKSKKTTSNSFSQLNIISHDSEKHNNDSKIIDLSTIIHENTNEIEKQYKIVEVIGQGSLGKVVKVIHKLSGIVRAMKIIKQKSIKIQQEELKDNEINILKDVSHPHIIKIYEYFNDNIYYYIVLEYIKNGDLKNYLKKTNGITEQTTSVIFKQLLSTVSYLHSKNIVHRDIKAENILIESFSETNLDEISIKLTDFGTANFNNKVFKIIGTPYYVAPEVLTGKYNEKCDMWSCGVLLYYLLVGKMPFQGKTIEDVLDCVYEGSFDTTCVNFKSISYEAQKLIIQLLTYNPEKRLSAEEALHSDWIEKFTGKTNTNNSRYSNLNGLNFKKYVNKMKKFKSTDTLHLSSLAFLVHFSETTEEMVTLLKIFKTLDKKGNGRITYNELKEGMNFILGKYITENELEKVFQVMDQDRNGYIEYEEFVRLCIDQNNLFSEKNLKIAFDNFDSDKNGFLSLDELRKFLGSNNQEYYAVLMEHVDENNDGKISYNDYSKMMKKILKSNTFKTYSTYLDEVERKCRSSQTIKDQATYFMNKSLENEEFDKNLKFRSCINVETIK